MPVTASFPNGPALNSRGIAVCNGPDIEGIGRGCGSAGAAGAVPPEVFESAVEGVCARAGYTETQLNKKAAKHFENIVIPISPSLVTFGRNDAGRRLAADCTRCFFGTPTENKNPPNSNSEWTVKL